MLAVVNCNLPVSDLNCSHSLYDTDQRPVAISELVPFYSQFLDVMFHMYTLQVPSFLEKPLLYLLRFYCFFLYQLTFTMLMHTAHFSTHVSHTVHTLLVLWAHVLYIPLLLWAHIL